MRFAFNPDLVDTATPPIPAAKAWLQAYDGRHGPPIDLSQAAPGQPPPQALLSRAAEAAGQPDSARYGPIQGDMALRTALAADIRLAYGGDVTADDVAITTGCNMAFVVAMMALAKAGDAVLLPTPWYFNHAMTLEMLGVEVRPVPTSAEAGFVPTVEDVRRRLDGRVRALVLVTPNNPTGAIYPPETLQAFARLAREAGVALVLDETYRDVLPAPAQPPHGLFGLPDWRETLIHLYSFSKAYAAPGWRLGALAAGGSVQDQVAKVLDCLQICPARPGQAALAWGVEALRPWREQARADITARAHAFRAAMAPVKGWRVDQIGAYFAYVRHPFEGVPCAEVAEMLARRWGVLALPGSYFGPGQEAHLRFAFANAEQPALADAAARMALIAR
jgi:aspartate/methionine/tyrosine aminotransferase